MSKPETSIGRRHLLSGAAALGFGALATTAVASGVSADELPPTGFGATGNEPSETEPGVNAAGVPLPEALPPLTPGAKVKSISAFQMSTYGFVTTTTASRFLKDLGGQRAIGVTDDASRLVASLDLEPGSTIVRIDFYGNISVGPDSQTYFLVSTSPSDGAFATLASGNTGTLAAGPWTRSITTPFTTQVGLDYFVFFEVTDTLFSTGIIVQYIPPSTTFVPITPYRAYDSRKAAVPNPGILGPNSNRVVNIVNAINDAGTIITPNVIPSTARAVTYNITATLTTGDNFLAVAPGLAASTTVSAINFAANQTLANAATVSVDNGTVKVFCGGNTGSSHFIIDITGYYI